VKDSPSKEKHTTGKWRMRPTQRRRPYPSHVPKENALSSFFCECNSSLNEDLRTQCQYLQMKSLNGFSNSLARAVSFTVESEIPRLGQIVALPNPSAEWVSSLNPRFLTELFSKTNFSK
jgi:hypothetical protein